MTYTNKKQVLYNLLIINVISVLSIIIPAKAESEELFDLSIEELMSIEVEPTASLTKTTRRLLPSAVTTITQEEINSSGARSLNELLEIYVPNLQFILHHWEAGHLGLRGIINDREEKYLLLVNGRVMNERTHFGVLSERDLSMLGDIHHIDIVRGSGSATYGAGAVSMVINIITDDAMTFQGLELTSRVGAIDEFYSQEIKYGKKFSDDHGLFAYFGIDKYLGANSSDAPFVLGTSFTDFWGRDVQGGTNYDYDINRYHEAYRNLPKLKTHVDYKNGPLNVWARYTRGGTQFTFAQDNIAEAPYGWLDAAWAAAPYPTPEYMHQPGSGYQQLTLFTGYKQEINPDLTIDYSFSYDLFDFERSSFSSKADPHFTLSHREEEYNFKVVGNWALNEQHSAAFGGQWIHERFGRRSPGYPNDQAVLAPYVQPPFSGESPKWNTDTFSIFAEDQWRINSAWTVFTGIRMDKCETTKYLYSPRLTAVYTPNEKDTLKFMIARSHRMTFAEEMRYKWEQTNKKSDPETFDSLELRYERQETPNLWYALSGYYHNIDVIAWDSGAYGVEFDAGTKNVGEYRQFGVEAEVLYKKDNFRLLLSHGFTKLLDFNKVTGSNTVITADPYGYGDDLANWSNHISKIVTSYKFDDKWTLDGNAQVYWGFPGAKDYAKYVTDNSSPISRDPGYNDPYGPSVFLSFGLQYEPKEDLILRLDAYDLLGLIDAKYNKTLYGFNSFADYRSSAPSLAFTLKYKF